MQDILSFSNKVFHMFTKYGTDNIIIMLAGGALLIILGIVSFDSWYSFPLFAFGILLSIFTFIFFRDPDRDIPNEALTNDCIIVSPADGKVTEIIETKEESFMKCNTRRISIFLSPLDVHVNRVPVNGIVKFFEYTRGDYLVAFHPKSSEKNEQTKIGVENSCGKILFKQIVGILARRLVWDIGLGDKLNAGQRFGMMKFGSRMDVFVDLNTMITVKPGDKVIAGETIIARMMMNNHNDSVHSI